MMKLKRNERIADVKGYEGLYAISSHGRVWSHRRKKWLVAFLTGRGYQTVKFSCYGEQLDKKVHRLVAEAFIPNTGTKPQVNHINGNKQANRVSNLEWCTLCANIAETFTSHLIRVEGGEVLDYGRTYC